MTKIWMPASIPCPAVNDSFKYQFAQLLQGGFSTWFLEPTTD